MKKNSQTPQKNILENNLVLIGKIFESFEALEETLGQLKLEEPLFITYAAKKSFANNVYNQIKNNKQYTNKFQN